MPKHDIRKKIGQIVKQLRIRDGYSQELLAEKIGLQPRAISQIENGNTFFSCNTLKKLYEVFNVPEKYFFDFSSAHEKQTDQERLNNIVEDLKCFNSKKLKLCQEIIKNISMTKMD